MMEHTSGNDLGSCLSAVDAGSRGSLLTKSWLQAFVWEAVPDLLGQASLWEEVAQIHRGDFLHHTLALTPIHKSLPRQLSLLGKTLFFRYVGFVMFCSFAG